MQPSPAPSVQIISQGQNSNGEPLFHALISDAENGIHHILERVGNRAFLHKLIGAGQVVTEELNIPVLQQVMGLLSDLTA